MNYAFTACILFALLLPGISVADSDVETPSRPSEQLESEERATLLRNAAEVHALIAESRALRDRLGSYIDEAGPAIEQRNGAIPSALAHRIAEPMAEAESLRKRLFHFALLHRNALYRIDDEAMTQAHGESRALGIVVSMAAATTLFENHYAMRRAFANEKALRDKLNEAYPEYGLDRNFYNDSVLRANLPGYRKAMSDAIRFFAENGEAIAYHINGNDKVYRELFTHISRSPVLEHLAGENAFTLITKLIGGSLWSSTKTSEYLLGRLQFRTSQLVGNTIGLVRWRDGKFKNDKALIDLMRAELQSGDILVEKTPFTLTDKTIPGHFGHAAIYVGTADDIRALGIADQPHVAKLLRKLGGRSGVIEALRNGVVLSSLEDFMNVDDVAILRPKRISEAERGAAISTAFRNIGKKYDFNFDVNSTETIVCSELIYIAYPQLDFLTKRVLTSFTISPDEIARHAGESPDDMLELVLFAQDGKLIHARTQGKEGLAEYKQLFEPATRVVADNLWAVER